MAATRRRSPLDYASVVAIALTASVAAYAFTASPVQAASPGFYQAQLAAPLEAPRSEIQSGVMWKCAGADCRAGEGNSRPAIVCARLARKLGPVAAFTVEGQALDPAALAKCNGESSAPLARR